MNVKNITIVNNEKEKMIVYGLEFIIDKTLNKFTDSIKIFHKRYINGLDIYVLEFTKRIKGSIYSNKFEISKMNLNKYMNFMKGIYNKEFKKNDIHKFALEEMGEIEFKVLNKNSIKLATCDCNSKRNFFVFTKREFLQYIKQIELIYKGKKLKVDVGKCLKNVIKEYQYRLSKNEKDSLYLEVLYILANKALDLKDREYFKNISNKIKKIESLY